MKVFQSSGSRKRATARATLRPGTGKVYVNKQLLEAYGSSFARQKIMEGIILAGTPANKFDFFVSVSGGGVNGQAEAVRLAICRALTLALGDKVKQIYLDYDRNFLVADVRFKEKAKPNSHGHARAKRQKSYR